MTPAENFVAKCNEYGFTFEVGNTIVSVSRTFPKGNLDEFVHCDMWGPHLLGMLKMTQPGSVWGTDGGSVGGHVAVTNGRYTLNKSGIGKRIIKELSKLKS